MHLSSIQLSCVAMVAVALGAAAPPSSLHHITRRDFTFFSLNCKGFFNPAYFARLTRVCDDCFNLFREPQLYTLCGENCFTSPYFKGCLESLYLYDQKDQIEQMIEFIGKR